MKLINNPKFMPSITPTIINRAILMLAIIASLSDLSSCKQGSLLPGGGEDPDEPGEEVTQTAQMPLNGTWWKLKTLVAENGEVRAPLPEGDDFFKIRFERKTMGDGRATTNELHAFYEIDFDKLRFEVVQFAETKLPELGDGDWFCDKLNETRSFDLKNDELTFYCENGRDSLLFQLMRKNIKLTNSEWKLVGYGDAVKDELIVARPENCDDCYTLAFSSENEATGRAISNEVKLTLAPKFSITASSAVDDSKKGNAALFYEAIRTATAFAMTKDELIIFYNNRKNYLLYRCMRH